MGGGGGGIAFLPRSWVFVNQVAGKTEILQISFFPQEHGSTKCHLAAVLASKLRSAEMAVRTYIFAAIVSFGCRP